MILDFSNARRAFVLSQLLDDYYFFLHSPRKEYTTLNQKELGFLSSYSPKAIEKLISKDQIEFYFSKASIVLVSSVSMYYKDYDPRIISLMNKFSGKIISIDYAWDIQRHWKDWGLKSSTAFKRTYDYIAVAGESDHAIMWKYSQPELDMYAISKQFTSTESVYRKYGLDPLSQVILVTSGAKCDYVSGMVEFLNRFPEAQIIWKIKYKQRKYEKQIKKGIRNRHIQVIIGEEKSHTDFLSPVCELSLVTDFHVNMYPLSFSQIEMIRAGVPSYILDKNGISVPGSIKQAAKEFWTTESYERFIKDPLVGRSQCYLNVPGLYCGSNFVRNLNAIS
jgi:hypothetical protein